MELIQENLELVVKNDLEKVLSMISDEKVNIFIDEFTVAKDEDIAKIEEISNKLSDESYFWVTIARANARSDKAFKTWLEGKESNDKWCVPTLTNALRNSKEIIEFDKCLTQFLTTDTGKNSIIRSKEFAGDNIERRHRGYPAAEGSELED